MPLSMNDQRALTNWIGGGASWNDVMSVSHQGLVDNVRFTEAARRRFTTIWTWSTFRMAGRAGELQERFYEMHGKAAFERRIQRALRLAHAYGYRPQPTKRNQYD